MISVGFSEKERVYTGNELRPHFLLTELGLKGSALGAFIGPCEVATEALVDWEDRLANDRISARLMVHFIGEFFGITLREGVLLQRLLMSIMGETLRLNTQQIIRRDGDDLFVKNQKLSVSIVTATPVSVLLHAGINIDATGAPVQAIGLKDLSVEPKAWISLILERFSTEWQSMDWACAKVRPVM